MARVVLGPSSLLALVFLIAPANAEEPQSIKGPKAKTSYALGVDLGSSLRQRLIDLDQAVFNQGLKDGLAGRKTLLTEEQVRTTIRDLQLEQRNKEIDKQKREGESFLAKNKLKEGVVTLESGLQYKILKEGSGNKPTVEDTVVCHYRSSRIDGTEFASSYKQNQPVTLTIKKSVKGWAEALQLMSVGSKWQLFIPPVLLRPLDDTKKTDSAGDAPLVFEVELISIGGETVSPH